MTEKSEHIQGIDYIPPLLVYHYRNFVAQGDRASLLS